MCTFKIKRRKVKTAKKLLLAPKNHYYNKNFANNDPSMLFYTESMLHEKQMSFCAVTGSILVKQNCYC